MPNITNTITASITATEDSTGSVIINRAIGIGFDSTTASGIEYMKLPAGVTVFQLPISPVCQLYVKNIDPALNIIVDVTLNGGAPQQIASLNPTDFVLLWQKPGGAPGNPGITNLTMTPSGANALVEYFLGG